MIDMFSSCKYVNAHRDKDRNTDTIMVWYDTIMISVAYGQPPLMYSVN